MFYSRVVIAGALVVMTAGVAMAQSDDVSSAAPSKPVSLLQILLKPASSQPAQEEAATAPVTAPTNLIPEHHAHTRVAHRHHTTRKYAHRKAHDEDTAATEQPAATDQTPANTTPTPPPVASEQATPDQTNMSAMVVDGHTVQIASPDQLNAMDMGAGDAKPAPQQATDAPPQQTAIADPPQAAEPQQQAVMLPSEPAATEEQPVVQDQKPEIAQPPVAMAAVVQQENGTDKSRDAWYEKVLMTLSGAFIASSVAWLLIGSAPPRRSEPMLTYDAERMAR